MLDAYQPMAGEPPRPTRDATREALLAAMGLDASTEVAARRAGERLDVRERLEWLPPTRVHVTRPTRGSGTVTLGVAAGAPRGDWQLELREESGRRTVREGRGSLRVVRLPHLPGPGYHTLRVRVDAGAALHEREQRLIVAPPSCWRVEEAMGRRRVHGLVANLYSLRGRGDWGVGDLGVVRSLVEQASRTGADFVGLSPLHATRGQGDHVSPYSPVSRLHRAEIHLDVEAVPEWRAWRAGGAARARRLAHRLRALRESSRVDYDAVQPLKRKVLRKLHALFVKRHGAGRTRRGAAYARFRKERPDVEAFATFQALAEHFERRGPGHDWRRWPAAYRDPASTEVRRFRERRSADCDFHAWVQFELERQLAAAARAARRRGQRIGLYQDLAVGSAPSGFEGWAEPGLHAQAYLGAPPDDFSKTGQDWGLPATLPHVLRERGYAPWVALLRAGFAHAGALRIDHAMGLVRLWWIPRGARARDGGYVGQPSGDLLAILALESRRHRALVVGEDLGTVPRGFPALLARWGILSTRVMLFERGRRSFHTARRYSRRALVTSTTHDLPPLAGYLVGRDLVLRHEAGALAPAALAAARRTRTAEARALRRRLGVAEDASPGELARAAVRFLAGTPSPLVGIALDDLVGETEPVNLPGLSQRQHPSWTRRMSVEVESLANQPVFRKATPALRRTRLR